MTLSQSAMAFVGEQRAWVGVVLGLAAFGESMLLVGAFLPATALLFLAGGLIATGFLDAASVLGWAMLGAIAGDAVSYSLGRRLGTRLLRHGAMSSHSRTIARLRLAIRRHGLATMVLGRFAGPLRALAPVMAGMMRMSPRAFHVVNILSGVIWVLAFVAPGYFAARGLLQLNLSTDRLTQLAPALVGIAAISVLVILAIPRLRGKRPGMTPPKAKGRRVPIGASWTSVGDVLPAAS